MHSFVDFRKTFSLSPDTNSSLSFRSLALSLSSPLSCSIRRSTYYHKALYTLHTIQFRKSSNNNNARRVSQDSLGLLAFVCSWSSCWVGKKRKEKKDCELESGEASTHKWIFETANRSVVAIRIREESKHFCALSWSEVKFYFFRAAREREREWIIIVASFATFFSLLIDKKETHSRCV